MNKLLIDIFQCLVVADLGQGSFDSVQSGDGRENRGVEFMSCYNVICKRVLCQGTYRQLLDIPLYDPACKSPSNWWNELHVLSD